MTGDNLLYLFLYNNSTITTKLSKYGTAPNLYPMIRNGVVCDPAWPVDSTCINFYYRSPTNFAAAYGIYNITVNCWAKNEYTSRDLAETVASETSRYNVQAYVITSEVGPVMKQADDREGYLTVVEIQIRHRDAPG